MATVMKNDERPRRNKTGTGAQLSQPEKDAGEQPGDKHTAQQEDSIVGHDVQWHVLGSITGGDVCSHTFVDGKKPTSNQGNMSHGKYPQPPLEALFRATANDDGL
ncbi:uncharacterized protein N7446_002204 [Penicillium canescens]|uniref:uncharacterized protein n=1 Tax=Penicillium canescens TaxID=5083 RepID=UPI0026DF2FDE|nr:uncharacterized protein N7446_002204 [Penicillium canescens]KAJ6074427.1 hypothetical protein N7446_002204 [Penicillium canescens]